MTAPSAESAVAVAKEIARREMAAFRHEVLGSASGAPHHPGRGRAVLTCAVRSCRRAVDASELRRAEVVGAGRVGIQTPIVCAECARAGRMA